MLIAQITDSHILAAGETFRGRIDTGAALARTVGALNALEPRPDLVLFTGDLADTGTAAEYAHLRDRLAGLTAPLAVVPGNHDRREALRAAFADNPWLPAAGPLHQVIEGFALRCIGLDTLVEGEAGGRLDPPTLDWLEGVLAAAPERPTVIFLHHPPFATGIGFMDEIGCAGGEGLAAVVARHPQVERVVCGHVHRPVTLRWAGTVASICPAIGHQVALDLRPGADSAFTLEPPAFQLHHWRPGTGLVTHTAYPDAPAGRYSFATGEAV